MPPSSSQPIVAVATSALSLTFTVISTRPLLLSPRFHRLSVHLSCSSVSARTESFSIPATFITPILLPPNLSDQTPITITLHSSSSSSSSSNSSSIISSATLPLFRLRSLLHSQLTLRLHSAVTLIVHIDPVPPTHYQSATFFLVSRALSLTFLEKLLPVITFEVVLVVSRRRNDGSWVPIFRSDTQFFPRVSTPLRYPPNATHQTAVRIDAYRLTWRRQLHLSGTLLCSLGFLTQCTPDTALPLYPPTSKTERTRYFECGQRPPLAGIVVFYGAALAAESPHAAIEFGVVLFARDMTDDGGGSKHDFEGSISSTCRGSGPLDLRRDAEASVPPLEDLLSPSFFPEGHPMVNQRITVHRLADAADRKWNRWKINRSSRVKHTVCQTLRATTAVFTPQVNNDVTNHVVLNVLKQVENENCSTHSVDVPMLCSTDISPNHDQFSEGSA